MAVEHTNCCCQNTIEMREHVYMFTTIYGYNVHIKRILL